MPTDYVIGNELMGAAEEVEPEATELNKGDCVIIPFKGRWIK